MRLANALSVSFLRTTTLSNASAFARRRSRRPSRFRGVGVDMMAHRSRGSSRVCAARARVRSRDAASIAFAIAFAFDDFFFADVVRCASRDGFSYVVAARRGRAPSRVASRAVFSARARTMAPTKGARATGCDATILLGSRARERASRDVANDARRRARRRRKGLWTDGSRTTSRREQTKR